jgi:hypothetical protein
MKTTIDLPDELLRRAKAVAAVRGISVRQLITESLEKELGLARTAAGGARHPDEAAALMRELDALAVQVSATWVGAQDAVDAMRDQRCG